MTLSLNVLRHLGVSLYSSTPAVLSEVVANAWDADATQVDIQLDKIAGSIVIKDNGIGMTSEQLNERYLKVGYERRKSPGGAVTSRGRNVMGRKGIGKLALFSIAKKVQIESVSGEEFSGLRMDFDEIQQFINQENDQSDTGDQSADYTPEPIDTSTIDFEAGTRITLTDLTKGIDQTSTNLRRRLARRFSVIGTEEFSVTVDGVEVSAADRDLLPRVQYVWTHHDSEKAIETRATRSQSVFARDSTTAYGPLRGWIGTVHDSAQLTESDSSDSLNRIPLMIRGKLAQEDLLTSIRDVGIYRSYLVGEVHADWLDNDDDEDITTSSRQALREDDPRYTALLEVLKSELSHVKSKWDALRNAAGVEAAEDIPEVKNWYSSLGKDSQKKARSLFGKIHRLGLSARDEAVLFSQGVVAFEVMKYRDNLDALDSMSSSDMVTLAKVMKSGNQLEEVMYHRIISQRIHVIDKLESLTTSNQRELFLQEHLFSHLWLLDPGWERASLPSMEKSMKKEFSEISSGLTKKEANSRLDIRYQKTTGQHVIVELKRAEVVTTTSALAEQIGKYRHALVRWLRHNNRENESFSIVCVVGKPPRDWAQEDGRDISNKMMAQMNARIVLYSELLAGAREAYNEYLSKTDEISKIRNLVDAVASRAQDDLASSDDGKTGGESA